MLRGYCLFLLSVCRQKVQPIPSVTPLMAHEDTELAREFGCRTLCQVQMVFLCMDGCQNCLFHTCPGTSVILVASIVPVVVLILVAVVVVIVIAVVMVKRRRGRDYHFHRMKFSEMEDEEED